MQVGAFTACNKVVVTPGSGDCYKAYTRPSYRASAVTKALSKGAGSISPKSSLKRSVSLTPSYKGQGQGLSLMLSGPSRRNGHKNMPVVRAQAAEDEAAKPLVSSGGTVLPYVGIACLGAILFGYHLGVVNGALEYLAKDLNIATNTVLQGWVVSSTLAGATIGSFTGGALADQFGCTRTFQLDSVPLIIGAVLSATAQSVHAMIIGRFLVGLGIGISSALVPLYISEISPTEIRGALGSVNQLFICIGILIEEDASNSADPDDEEDAYNDAEDVVADDSDGSEDPDTDADGDDNGIDDDDSDNEPQDDADDESPNQDGLSSAERSWKGILTLGVGSGRANHLKSVRRRHC